MQTARTLERLWVAGRYAKLVGLIGGGRSVPLPEAPAPVVAAAAVLVRLGELGQPAGPFAGRLRAHLGERQQADGSWSDDLRVTALCVRALGVGAAADRGRAALARVQHDDGGFPTLAVRRLPGDVPATLAVVSHLLHAPTENGPDLDAALVWLGRGCRDRRALDVLRARRMLRSAA